MKPQDKKNIISTIQHNLKQMQYEAQQFLDKHHTNLPPICSARHYLFHSLNNNTKQVDAKTIQKRAGRDRSDKGAGDKSKVEQKNQEQKNGTFNPKTSIYNLQFTKKIKNDQSKSLKIPNMNLTLIRSRMNGSWRAGRYMDNLSSRTSLESSSHNDKLKTIVMNSEVLDHSDKDLKIAPNAFSPKLSRLNLPKKQSDILQKYLTRFKQYYKSTQLPRSQSIDLDQLADRSAKELQKIIPKEPETEHCSKRSRVRICRKTIQTSQISSGNNNSVSTSTGRKSFKTIDKRIKQKLQEQLLRLPKHKSLHKKEKKVNIDVAQLDCSPWNHDDKLEYNISYDFS